MVAFFSQAIIAFLLWDKLMFIFKKITISQGERGLFFRDKVLLKVLEPGIHSYFDPTSRCQVEVHNLAGVEFTHPMLPFFRQDQPALCERHFQVVEIGNREVGLIYLDERPHRLLPPGSRQAYWRGPVAVRVEILDIGERFAVAPELLPLLTAQIRTNEAILQTEVPEEHVGLLTVDGRHAETLSPGRYAWIRFQRNLAVELVDLRLQTMEVAGQEILSKDRVTLRITLIATYRLADPVKARGLLKNPADHLYRELQFALRRAAGGKTLDALLAEKGDLDAEIGAEIRAKAEPCGIEVTGVGIRDIILPGDMKEILNQVVAVEKQAQANLIRRREETAAMRSALNTAKLMEDNPILLRLKELEVLEKVSEKVGAITLFGGLDGLLRDLVRIAPSPDRRESGGGGGAGSEGGAGSGGGSGAGTTPEG